eukprot:TRINITY_DN4424_c0_g3_i7.p1 TRINITY_DN4424_c0_g3~~TRINITY_DN4424_c0_g3_i7.p1  ORF type:complete len:347 (-),score=59.32 TRINITY_DN4424_c0_g3_i7:31-1071(-)
MVTAFIFYAISGLGITVGYHRLFAHRSYDAIWPIRLFFLAAGTSAFQGTALWWCRDHRAHHRYVDTPKDPYSIKKGFFWAHMGWLLKKQDTAAIGHVDASDLENDPIIRFQDKYYTILAVLLGIVLPVLVCGLGWGDYWGGFYFAAITKVVLVLQSTFCINSLAHFIGDTTFDDIRSPRDCWWVSLLTFGEGYHNFHHQFPYDYRNGVKSWAFDPSKWIIWALSHFNATFNVKRFPREEIKKCELQMQELKLKKEMKIYNWGPKIEDLPTYTWKQFVDRCAEGSSLIVIEGVVHDVHDFADNHPGGVKILKNYIGKDATKAFNETVYNHSRAARNILSRLRVGVIA